MKRVLGYGLCAVLFAFAVGCKDKGGAGGGASGGEMTPAEFCKKIEEMATKEGEVGMEIWNELKADCEKEITEEKAKLGDKWKAFTDYVVSKDKLSTAIQECDTDS